MPKSQLEVLKQLDLSSTRWRSISERMLKSHAKLANAAWQPFDPSQEYASLAFTLPPRYLIEIVCKKTPYDGSYFRAESLADRNFDDLALLVPSLPSLPLSPTLSAAQIPLWSARAIWLCSLAKYQRPWHIVGYFRSTIFLPVVFAPTSSHALYKCLSYYLGFDLCQFRPETVFIPPSDDAHCDPTMPVPLTRGMHRKEILAPRLAVISLPHWPSLYSVLVAKPLLSWFVVLLIPPEHWQNWRLPSLAFARNASIIAVVPWIDPSPTLPAALLNFADISLHPSMAYQDLIDYDPLVIGPDFLSQSEKIQLFRNWLIRVDPRMAIPWPALEARNVVLTLQAQRILNAINNLWANAPSSGGYLRELCLVKVFHASGATCLLRSIAWEVYSKHQTAVYWIRGVPLDAPVSHIAVRLRNMIGFARNVLLCTDQLPRAQIHLLCRAAELLAQFYPLRIIWLHVEASTPIQWKQNTPCVDVSPFVESHDLEAFETTLAAANNNHEALMSTAKIAQDGDLSSRHVFVFALAAAKGINIPISDWIDQLYDHISESPPLRDISCAFALVSAFAVASPLPSLSEAPFQLNDCHTENAAKAFNELFPVVCAGYRTNGYWERSCLHPFLARLFLCERYRMDWSQEPLNLSELADAWKNSIDVLHPHSASVLPNLLFSNHGFTPLIIEAWNSSQRQSLEPVEMIKRFFIIPLSQLMGPRADLLLSHLWRSQALLADSQSKMVERIDKAILTARAAAKEVESEQSFEIFFPIRHNLASTLLYAFSNPLLSPSSWSHLEQEAHEILQQLHQSSPDTSHRGDLVDLALKWLQTEDYLDHWKQLATASIKLSSPSPLPVNGWPSSSEYRLFANCSATTLSGFFLP